jgi:hypothetical protein
LFVFGTPVAEIQFAKWKLEKPPTFKPSAPRHVAAEIGEVTARIAELEKQLAELTAHAFGTAASIRALRNTIVTMPPRMAELYGFAWSRRRGTSSRAKARIG